MTDYGVSRTACRSVCRGNTDLIATALSSTSIASSSSSSSYVAPPCHINDIILVPRPRSSSTSGTKPAVDGSEASETLETFLRICYPVPNLRMESLPDIREVHVAVVKQLRWSTRHGHGKRRSFIAVLQRSVVARLLFRALVPSGRRDLGGS